MRTRKYDRQNTAWRQFLSSVSRAARREGVGRSILRLAWTAGPVTFLALQGGYIIGYGELAPRALWFYFGAYTIIAGLTAVVLRFAYGATRGEQLEAGRRALARLMTVLPELIFQTRNENLAYYPPENRKYIGAWELLDDPDAGPSTVKTAVHMATDNPALAEAAERIETYRRRGLSVLADDERMLVQSQLDSSLGSIEESSPELAHLIEERFRCVAPRMRDGRPRFSGFIERILAAGESENFALMTLRDAEEAFVFALEILAGRNFSYLRPEYVGARCFTDASAQLDRARSAYRSAVYSRNSRLRILLELLSRSDAVHHVPATMVDLTDPTENARNVYQALEREIGSLSGWRGTSAAELRGSGRADRRTQIHRLRKAVEMYKQFYRRNQSASRRYRDLEVAEHRYHEVRSMDGASFEPRLLPASGRGTGIRIHQHAIEVSQHDRLDIAREISQVLVDSFDDRPDVKATAFVVLSALNARINLNRWDIQFAIETNNAAYLTSLDPSLTSQTRADWIASIANDVQWNPVSPLRRLVSMLLSYHQMDFDEESIDRLAEEFHIAPARLSGLGSALEPARVKHAQQFSHIVAPPPNPQWDHHLRRAGAALL